MSEPMEEYTEEMFDEWLDEVYDPHEVAGVTIYASSILRNCDPIAYRIAYSEWIDYMEERDNE